MAKYPAHILLGLLAALATLPIGCSKYSDYQANMTYVNDEILAQEQTRALEQLREARARYEAALRSGPVAPGSEVEKTFMAARDKYLIIKKEKELRAGRPSTTKDLSNDPEAAIPASPHPTKRSPGPKAAPPESPAPAATPPATEAAPAAERPLASAPAAPAAAPTAQAVPAAQAAAETTYIVQQGDTLGAIAKRHNVALAVLASHNSLSSLNKLAPGQVLKIPQR
jgi:nucleoid-associated protein YgaU